MAIVIIRKKFIGTKHLVNTVFAIVGLRTASYLPSVVDTLDLEESSLISVFQIQNCLCVAKNLSSASNTSSFGHLRTYQK